MGWLCTRGQVKRALGIPTAVTQWDGLIDQLVGAVPDEFADMAGLPNLSQTAYTETFDVPDPGTRELGLKAWPIVTVTAVTNDGSLVADADWYTDDEIGYLYLKGAGNYFTTGHQKVEVGYTAGLTFTDRIYVRLQRGAIAQCCAEFNRLRKLGFRSGSLGRAKFVLAEDHLTPEAAAAIGSIARVF